MLTKKATFSGIEYEFVTNNSGWISNPLPDGITPEFMQELPRLGVNSKGRPVVQDDNGKHLVLGSAELCTEADKSLSLISTSTASGIRTPGVSLPKPKAWEDLSEDEQKAWNEIKKACKDDASKASYEAIRPRTRAEIEAEQAELKKQMKIAALQAQLAELLGE